MISPVKSWGARCESAFLRCTRRPWRAASSLALTSVLGANPAHAQGLIRFGLPWLPWAGLALLTLGSGLVLAHRRRHPARPPADPELTLMVLPTPRAHRPAARSNTVRRAVIDKPRALSTVPAWSIEILHSLSQPELATLCLALYREKGLSSHGPVRRDDAAFIRLYSDTSTDAVAVARCHAWAEGPADLDVIGKMLSRMQAESLAAGFYVALGGFSAAAKTHALSNRITLIDARLLLAMIARLPMPVQQRLWVPFADRAVPPAPFCRHSAG